MHPSNARRAFTLTDLVAMLAAIAFAGTLLLQVGWASKERSNRVKCASNLRQIGQGLALYANDFKEYPRTTWDQASPCKVDFDNAGFDSPDGKTVTPNNVTAAMFLLVRNCDLNPEVFVCPTSNQDKDTLDGKTIAERSNFTSGDNVSYSFTNPYPQSAPGMGTSRGYKWHQNVPSGWAIAADRNDGARNAALDIASPLSDQRTLNSSNHEWEGQNVLFNDGHVEWASTAWTGANRDNIYTRALTVRTVSAYVQAAVQATDAEGFPEPAMDMDSVLVPAWPVAPFGVVHRETGIQWRAIVVLLILCAVAFSAYKIIRRASATASQPAQP